MERLITIPNHYSFLDHDVYDFDKALSIYDWEIKSSEVVIDMSQCLTANYQALALVVLGCCRFGGHPLTLIQPSFRTP